MPRGNIRTLADMRAPEPFLAITQRAVFSCQGEPAAAPLDAWIRQVEGCATAKEKGDHFEELCVAYLLHPRGGGGAGIVQAWTLSDLPEPVRAAAGLPARDYGIDIVALDARGGLHAVQAKFRGRSAFRPSRHRRALQVTWKELSTFYALARRGPYAAHWVITTADSVSRAGGVCEQDRSVCYRGLRALPPEFWRDLAQMHGNRLAGDAPAGAAPTPDEVRALRLARLAPEKDDEAVDYDAIWGELGY